MIYLRTSRGMGFRVRSGEAVGKLVGTPGGIQRLRALEWSFDPLGEMSVTWRQY